MCIGQGILVESCRRQPRPILPFSEGPFLQMEAKQRMHQSSTHGPVSIAQRPCGKGGMVFCRRFALFTIRVASIEPSLDSISENHFFSLSCTLGPHVIATPNHTQHPHFDRAWPQNLYLNPNSPLLTELTFPPGFNISGTPLATVRRIDLLFSQAEINDIHRSIHPHPEDSEDNIFSDEATWTLPLNEYITQFISPLPEARYSTMIVGTAGHWTVSLFNGTTPRGMGGILNLFEVVTKKWASQVQSVVGRTNDDCAAEGSLCKAPRRRVIVRDYLPGHDNCHDHTAPTTEIPPIYSDWDWMNWKYIPKFNNVWKESHSRFVYSLFLTLQSQNLLGAKKYRDIDYLPIGRPGMLRPDGVRVILINFSVINHLKACYGGLPARHDRDGHARRLDALHLALYHTRIFLGLSEHVSVSLLSEKAYEII